MKCQCITAYGQPLAAMEKETPHPAGHEVLLKVRHCGVCHSDIHMQDGFFELGGGKKLDVRNGRELPFVLGHEIEAQVVELGPDAAGGPVAIGDHVAIYPWIGCGQCADCAGGREHLCGRPRNLGITVDGGYASHVLVPDPRYLLDYGDIDPAFAGALMCSGLTAYSALQKAERRAAEGPVMIVGLGGVGMMALGFARAMFGKAPLVADIDPAKRAAALKAGAEATFDPADRQARKSVFSHTGGGVAAALDFAGTESSLDFAIGCLRKGGKAVVAGLMGGRFSMPAPMFALRAIAIEGTYVGSLDQARAMLDMVRDNRLPPIPMQPRPLEEANASLDDLRRAAVTGRIILSP